MQPRDPTEDTEPDFESDAWQGARNAIISGGKTAEEATEILRQSWKVQHEKDIEAWNERLQQPPGSEQGNEGNIQTTPNPPLDEAPEWLNRPTPNALEILPARHVLMRLEKKEFVELWHFTAQGCRDAAAMDLAAPEDTFGLVNTDKGILFQTIGASSVSSKVVKDENLSWDQLTEGRKRLLECMNSCGWSVFEVKELAKFYINLDLHPIRSQSYGLQAILRYQERVRRDWVRSLKIGRPYAIGTINDDLMNECQRQIAMEIQARNNVSHHAIVTKY